MTRIRFTRLEQPRSKALHLCRLAQTCLEEGHSLVIRVADLEQAQSLDRFLWTWKKDSFLPHCLDDPAQTRIDEPIVIVTAERNPNGATALIMGTPCSLPFIESFALVFDFAEVYADDLAQAARTRFRSYRAHGLDPQMDTAEPPDMVKTRRQEHS